MSGETYHRTALGRFDRHVRADLDGFVYLDADAARGGRWPYDLDDADADAIAEHNRRETPLAHAAIRAWRGEPSDSHRPYHGREDSPAYVYQRCDDARLVFYDAADGGCVFAFRGTDRDTGAILDAAGPVDCVASLGAVLTDYAPADYDCSALPTFGGDPPAHTLDVYSWDATHLLIGPDSWEPVARAVWQRTHGGDE